MISFMQKLKSSGTAVHHHNNTAPTGRSRARGGGRPAGAAIGSPKILASEDEVGRRAEDEGRPPDVLASKEAEGRPSASSGHRMSVPARRRRAGR